MEIATLVFSGIAALGVVVDQWRRWANRPLGWLECRVEKSRYGSVDGPGEFIVRVRNSGTQKAVGVSMTGFGCMFMAHAARPDTQDIDLGDVGMFSFDLAGPVEKAWVLISWRYLSDRHGRARSQWEPLDSAGPLGEVRRRQQRWGYLKVAAVQLATRKVSMPSTTATGTTSATPRLAALPLRQASSWPQLPGLRRAWLRLWRAGPVSQDLFARPELPDGWEEPGAR